MLLLNKGIPLLSLHIWWCYWYLQCFIFSEASKDDMSPALQGIEAFLNCRTIRIGSYRYTPKEKVSFGLNICT